MGIVLSAKEVDALYESLKRLVEVHVPGCTYKQIVAAIQKTHSTRGDSRAYTRLDAALKIYWELAENRVQEEKHSLSAFFMGCVRGAVETTQREKIEIEEQKQKAHADKIAARDFWTNLAQEKGEEIEGDEDA